MEKDVPTHDQVVAAIVHETANFNDQRARLESSLIGLLDSRADVVSELLSTAEEFGQDYAIDRFQKQLLAIFPNGGELCTSVVNNGRGQLEAILECQDRLDDLTRQRETMEGRETLSSKRAINIQGQEFEIDGNANELRERDGARSSLAKERSPTLTEILAREVKAEKVQPQRESPSRSRSR